MAGKGWQQRGRDGAPRTMVDFTQQPTARHHCDLEPSKVPDGSLIFQVPPVRRRYARYAFSQDKRICLSGPDTIETPRPPVRRWNAAQ